VSERDRRRSVAAPTRRRSPARTTTMRSTRATIADELAHLRLDRHGRDRDSANSRECDDPATTALASFSPEKTKAPHAQGFQMVGGTGLEPVTSSLSSWVPAPPTRNNSRPPTPAAMRLRGAPRERGRLATRVDFGTFGPRLGHGRHVPNGHLGSRARARHALDGGWARSVRTAIVTAFREPPARAGATPIEARKQLVEHAVGTERVEHAVFVRHLCHDPALDGGQTR
jgi:hypothetical protein